MRYEKVFRNITEMSLGPVQFLEQLSLQTSSKIIFKKTIFVIVEFFFIGLGVVRGGKEANL